MWLMFQATFSLGSYPMDWIEAGVEALGSWVAGIMPEGPLNDLLVNGVIAGVGGVIVFLPNILILFFFNSLMEDTGYKARAAFIMEFLWQNFVSVDFSVTSGVKYGTIHISVGLSLQIPEGIRFYIRFLKNVIPVGMRKQ